MIRQTYTNLSIRVSRNGQPGLAIDVPFTQINISRRTWIDDFNISTLVCARANIGSNDDKRIYVSLAPNALFRRIVIGGKVEFDSESFGQ